MPYQLGYHFGGLVGETGKDAAGNLRYLPAPEGIDAGFDGIPEFGPQVPPPQIPPDIGDYNLGLEDLFGSGIPGVDGIPPQVPVPQVPPPPPVVPRIPAPPEGPPSFDGGMPPSFSMPTSPGGGDWYDEGVDEADPFPYQSLPYEEPEISDTDIDVEKLQSALESDALDVSPYQEPSVAVSQGDSLRRPSSVKSVVPGSWLDRERDIQGRTGAAPFGFAAGGPVRRIQRANFAFGDPRIGTGIDPEAGRFRGPQQSYMNETWSRGQPQPVGGYTLGNDLKLVGPGGGIQREPPEYMLPATPPPSYTPPQQERLGTSIKRTPPQPWQEKPTTPPWERLQPELPRIRVWKPESGYGVPVSSDGKPQWGEGFQPQPPQWGGGFQPQPPQWGGGFQPPWSGGSGGRGFQPQPPWNRGFQPQQPPWGGGGGWRQPQPPPWGGGFQPQQPPWGGGFGGGGGWMQPHGGGGYGTFSGGGIGSFPPQRGQSRRPQMPMSSPFNMGGRQRMAGYR